VFLSAAEALIAGGAGIVLAADILPVLLIKPTAPFWAHYLPYSTRYALCALFSVASFLLTALFEPVEVKLLGVVCAAIAAGWGEVTSLGMLAFYKESAVTAWSSGTGMAGVAGAGFFLFLSTVLGLSNKTTLLIGLVFPVMYALAYFVGLGPATSSPGASRAGSEAGEAPEALDGGGSVAGLSLRDMDVEPCDEAAEEGGTRAAEAEGLRLMGRRAAEQPPSGPAGLESSDATKSMSFWQRLTAARGLLPVMAALFIVYFAEYTISTGVAGTLSFPEDKLPKKAFYERAQLTYQVGVFLSRSSGQLVPIDTLWPMPVLQTLNLVVFIVQACTQMISSSWALLALVFFEGLLGGAVYVNAFRKLRAQSPPELREFYMGAASVADTAGISVSSGVSAWLEPFLDHLRATRGLPTA